MKKKHQDLAKIAAGAFMLASALPEAAEAAESHSGYLAAGCGGKRSSSNDTYYWSDNSSDVTSCRSRGSCSSKQGCKASSDPSGKKTQSHSCGSQASSGSNHSCSSQSSGSGHSCSSQRGYAASCGAHGCGGAPSTPVPSKPSSGELADASEDGMPAAMPSNGKGKPAEGILSEAQLLKELSPQTRSMYLGMDDEGKAMAIKMASRSTDKNQAVKDAYRISMEKKGAGSYR